MKLWCLILVVFLSVAVPFGATSVIAQSMQQDKCPMHADMSSIGIDHDCCDPGFDGSGSPCKSIEMCKTCTAFYPFSAPVQAELPQMPPARLAATLPDRFISSHDPSGLWRPPRLV